MHMADALVSPPVAGVAAVAAVTLLAVAARKVKHTDNDAIVPLMGVMGAFVFAAQMINFTIPGTGSSGHIVGGILLGAILGPWGAFLTLASVIVVQCLVFADGGLMALGCNLINMAACSTLIAYPLIYRPIAGRSRSTWRVCTAAVAACLVGLELGALAVTIETELSGVTALPFDKFLGLMASIHALIGIGEGLATAAVLYFLRLYTPDILAGYNTTVGATTKSLKKGLIALLTITAILAATFTWIASSHPDGLEWSIERIIGSTDLPSRSDTVSGTLESIQSATTILPDYSATWAGLVGCAIVVALVWLLCRLITTFRKTN